MPDSLTSAVVASLRLTVTRYNLPRSMASLETTSAAPRPRPASLVPTAVIGVVALVVAVVFASTASWYQTFLAIHILATVVWIGGGLMLTVFGLLAQRAQDGEQLAQLARMPA